MMLDKGKGDYPILFTPKTDFYSKFNCAQVEQFNMGSMGGNSRPKDGYYEDARGWLLASLGRINAARVGRNN
ncbi:MAG TPA: hypothetical protein DCO68_11080 [Methylophilaceae bacterium]|nr:hypothetical protein [Methylophilaceae bacterium]HAJ72609.1 hypothetical protein [Methylophilaceae bacterium]